MPKPPKTVDPVDRHALAQVKDKWAKSLASYKETPCTNQAQKDWWAQFGGKAQSILKALEDERKSLTQPLLEQQRKLKAEFDGAAAPVAEAKALAKAKIEAYDLSVREAERKALADARALAEAGDTAKAIATVQSAPEPQTTKGVATRYEWTTEVMDWSLVPEAFTKKVLDHDAVKAYTKSLPADATPEVPGLRFTLRATTRMNGR